MATELALPPVPRKPDPRPAPLGQTHRKDAWWVFPLVGGLVLAAFVVYATARVFENNYYDYGYVAYSRSVEDVPGHAHLLSPFYSPLIIWAGMPAWLSPAMLILWAPGGFRLTCYYYRKAYYRAFFLSPPGCTVGKGRKHYAGETRLLLFQNLHRYFLYLALPFIVILTLDVIWSMMWPTGDGRYEFGVSIATFVLALNTILLALYTFSCHSFRHIVGGNLDCFSCPLGGARFKAWRGVSLLNQRHMFYAWVSLVMVALADVYVTLVARQVIPDIRLI